MTSMALGHLGSLGRPQGNLCSLGDLGGLRETFAASGDFGRLGGLERPQGNLLGLWFHIFIDGLGQ